MPFLDIAYQGFGDNIDADAAAVRLFAAAELNVFVSSSFSKSFSLYGERVGALSIITAQQGRSRARAVATQARDPHELFESADARRLGRRGRARFAGTARHVGNRNSAKCATVSARCVTVWSNSLKASGVDRDFSFVNAATRHVLVLGPDGAASRPSA